MTLLPGVQMKFCRINLLQTNYNTTSSAFLLSNVEKDDRMDQLQEIYKSYCAYKKFESVMPLFYGMIFDKYTDVIGYTHDNKLVAFSLVKRYDRLNAESIQFAWNYKMPELRLGERSLEHECAFYKNQGFEYLYLGEVAEYKKKFQGFEILSNPYV